MKRVINPHSKYITLSKDGTVTQPELTVPQKLRDIIQKEKLPEKLMTLFNSPNARISEKIKIAETMLRYANVLIEKVANTDEDGKTIATPNFDLLGELWKEKLIAEIKNTDSKDTENVWQ